MNFSHKQPTVSLDDDLHHRLLVETTQRCKLDQDVREVMSDIVAGVLGPWLDELEAARDHLRNPR